MLVKGATINELDKMQMKNKKTLRLGPLLKE